MALWQSNDCPSASKATLMNMDKYFMWIHYERLHNHNKAKHTKTVCIFLGIYCTWLMYCCNVTRRCTQGTANVEMGWCKNTFCTKLRNWSITTLIQCSWEKNTAILQMTFSIAFSWQKNVFWSILYLNMSLAYMKNWYNFPPKSERDIMLLSAKFNRMQVQRHCSKGEPLVSRPFFFEFLRDMWAICGCLVCAYLKTWLWFAESLLYKRPHCLSQWVLGMYINHSKLTYVQIR